MLTAASLATHLLRETYDQAQGQIKLDKKAFVEGIRDEAAEAQKTHDWRVIHSCVKRLRGQPPPPPPMVELEDGQPAPTPAAARQRWMRQRGENRNPFRDSYTAND